MYLYVFTDDISNIGIWYLQFYAFYVNADNSIVKSDYFKTNIKILDYAIEYKK